MIRNKTGQISLMMIVAIALGMTFLAMVMNWNRAVQVKTQCQVAATTAAAGLVSRLASYGEQQVQEYLKGKMEHCDQNGILGLVIMVIIIIILIVITIFTCGAGAAGAGLVAGGALTTAGMAVVGLAISLVLVIATIALQMTYIQPKITSLWNKMQQNIQTMEGQFLESGLQMALQGAVTDNETIPDLLDYDLNGKWNVPGLAGSSNERVARLVYYYTNRLATMPRNIVAANTEKFRNELSDFVIDLGLYEGNANPARDSSCCSGNRCETTCVYRPEKADQDTTTCSLLPYEDYPFSYDPLTCMSYPGPTEANSRSFAALLGQERVWTATTGSEAAPKDLEKGPLFKFLWSIKASVKQDDDKGNPLSPDYVFGYVPYTFKTGSDRVKLKYFYDPAETNPCPVATPLAAGTDTNRWRPGDDRFCNKDRNPVPDSDPVVWKYAYIAPHSANCPYYPSACSSETSKDQCSCSDATDAKKVLWKNDQFDEAVATLRDLSTVMAGLRFNHLNSAQLDQLLKATPTLTDEFTASFGDNGPIAQLKTNMAKVRDVMVDSSIYGGPDIDAGLYPDLARAQVNARIFGRNILTATATAFTCDGVLPADTADCVANSGGGDRLKYLLYLFNQLKGAGAVKPQLGNDIIYGWQSPGIKGRRGYRHVVKVEAAIPKRCDWWAAERTPQGGLPAACGTNTFPWVKTYKKGTFKRCYGMWDTDGCVKVRISRWDESPLSRTISFMNGLTLWKPGFGHPINDNKPRPKDLEACFNHDRVTLGATTYFIPDSFMINKNEDYETRYGLECHDAVKAALRQSFVTEVCANYYSDGNKFKMRFIRCNEACPSRVVR